MRMNNNKKQQLEQCDWSVPTNMPTLQPKEVVKYYANTGNRTVG